MMARIFFKNLGRSLLTSLVVMIIAFIGTMIIMLVCEEILHIKFSAMALSISDGVITFVVGFLWFCLATKWEWFYTGEDDCCEKPPHLILGFLLLLLIFALTGGTSIVILVLGFDKIAAAATINYDYNFMLLTFPSLAVSSFLYFFVMVCHYFLWQVCWHCGHMFCIDYYCTGIKSWDETSYKSYTTKENIGSISANDRKIADITGNVNHSYTETTHYTRSSYQGHCSHCGRGKDQSKLDFSSS